VPCEALVRRQALHQRQRQRQLLLLLLLLLLLPAMVRLVWKTPLRMNPLPLQPCLQKVSAGASTRCRYSPRPSQRTEAAVLCD